VSTYEFDPETYAELMRADIPAYPRLQEAVAAASEDVGTADGVGRILDLGTGTGETVAAVLARHGGASAIGVDKNRRMLAAARDRLAGQPVELRVAELTDPLPAGPFDLVVSALAIHHLDGADKADLFRRIATVLAPRGRFVLGDVVIPADPADAVTPGLEGHDRPSTVPDQLGWLADAGFDAVAVWSERDLVVLRADRPARWPADRPARRPADRPG
jgi:tRNA (cmo5U34)-methyltransferase